MNKIDFGTDLITKPFATIDDWIEPMIKHHIDDDSGSFTCKFIVIELPYKLLAILESPTNKPSKYDLSLIDAITNYPAGNKDVHKKILAIYRDRK